MPQTLTKDRIRFFEEQGYLSPIRAIDEAEAVDCRRRLEAFENDSGKSAVESLHMKAHLYFSWAWAVTRSLAVVGAAQSLLGTPDIFVLASRFWIKEARDLKFTSWHQDLAYFGLDRQEMITVWLALSPATVQSGAMKFIPGSHRTLHRHDETYDKNNLLSRGQTVRQVDETRAVDGVLKPGEFSIHHGNLLHSSPPNESDDRRIGLGLMLFPAHAQSTTGRRSATLLSGEDRFGYWDHDPMPTCDRDPVIWELMHATDRHYRDKTRKQEAEVAR
jgi:non-haem Fe2+, alpha-ketoglutarate-dependent halogenase